MIDQQHVEALAEQLIDVLCDHLAAHRELAEVLEEKEHAVVALKLSELDDITENERALINRIGALEERRCDVTAAIGEHIEAPAPSRLRISDIVPYISEEIAGSLLELRDGLRTVADRIEKVQARNRTLISHSLDHVHLFLSVLSGVDPDAKHYSPEGEVTEAPHPAVLDRRF